MEGPETLLHNPRQQSAVDSKASTGEDPRIRGPTTSLREANPSAKGIP